MAQLEAIHSRDGKIYWIEQHDSLYKQRLISGQYQRSNWTFAQSILPQFRNCIDIGSNNAVNAIHYAEQFEWVECFEPTQLAQTLWKNTVRDNSVHNVTLHTQALGEAKTTTQIVLHPKNGGHNHLAHWDKNPRAHAENSTKQTQTVSVRTLDDYDFERVDFIKIDVEGYEWFVLQGALNTIKRERPLLQLEIVGTQCRKFNYTAEQMIEWLRSLDYKVASKRDGWLKGQFHTHKGTLLYDGLPRKGDMDLFFIPTEWPVQLHTSTFGELFEIG